MRTVLLLASLTLTVPVSALTAADTTDRPPNVVFILADDLGYAELG